MSRLATLADERIGADMRRFNALVFDDIVTSEPATTSSTYDAALGQFDNVSLHVVIDTASASGTLQIFVQHSCNGEDWVSKFGGAALLTATVTAGATTTKTAGEPVGGELSMAFVRLGMRLNTTGLARVRLYATARDAAG